MTPNAPSRGNNMQAKLGAKRVSLRVIVHCLGLLTQPLNPRSYAATAKVPIKTCKVKNSIFTLNNGKENNNLFLNLQF